MEHSIRQRVGRRIRYYRNLRGYTLAQFAQRIHKSKSSISKYEHGEVAIDIETLDAIAGALSVSLSQLVDVDEGVRPPMFQQTEHAPIRQRDLLYLYFWDGRVKNHIRRNVLALGEDTGALYADVADFEHYRECKYHYAGQLQRFDASVRLFLVNAANERDLVFLNYADPLTFERLFYGFFSSYSVGQFQPFSVKCLLSASVIEDQAALTEMLMLSKQDIRDVKKLNMFRVTPPNFLV